MIRITNNQNKNNKIIKLGLTNLDNCNSEINIKENNKKLNIIKTQPNLSNNQENNKNLMNYNNNFNKNTNNKKILKHYVSTNDINKYDKDKKNNKLQSQKNSGKIIEIPIKTKDINILYKKEKKADEYYDLANSKIITPKKRYIFNRIHPSKLLRDFNREMTSIQNSKYYLK